MRAAQPFGGGLLNALNHSWQAQPTGFITPVDAAMFSTPSTVACDASLAPATIVSPTTLAWFTVLLATEKHRTGSQSASNNMPGAHLPQ